MMLKSRTINKGPHYAWPSIYGVKDRVVLYPKETFSVACHSSLMNCHSAGRYPLLSLKTTDLATKDEKGWR